jgi:hypothetical protein
MDDGQVKNGTGRIPGFNDQACDGLYYLEWRISKRALNLCFADVTMGLEWRNRQDTTLRIRKKHVLSEENENELGGRSQGKLSCRSLRKTASTIELSRCSSIAA